MRILLILILLGASPVLAMEHYTSPLQDQNGSAISGASVYVYAAGTQTLATIYSDNGTTTKANPFTTGVDGIYDFYAASGVYDIVFVSPRSIISDEKTRRIALFDIHDGAFLPVTALPEDPILGATVLYLADSSVGACDSAGSGTSLSVCMWDGSAWTPIAGGVGGSSGLEANRAVDRSMEGAVSPATCVQIGGTVPGCLYEDPTEGFVIKTVPETDSTWRCWTNQRCVIKDMETGNNILVIDPDAADSHSMYLFGSGFRPLKSGWVPASLFEGDGVNCPATSSVFHLNSGPLVQTMICGPSANGEFDFNAMIPSDWDGGAVFVELVYVQTAANTSAMNSDVKAQCRGAGETPSSTWGSSVAIDDAAVTGSNANDITRSAAITPAGTCTRGDMVYFRVTLDVTGTTTPEATLHFLGARILYSQASLSN